MQLAGEAGMATTTIAEYRSFPIMYNGQENLLEDKTKGRLRVPREEQQVAKKSFLSCQ